MCYSFSLILQRVRAHKTASDYTTSTIWRVCCFRQWWWCGDDDMIVPSPSWSRLRATILDPIVKTGNLSIVYYRCCIPLCVIVWAVHVCVRLFPCFHSALAFSLQCSSCAHFCLFSFFPFSHMLACIHTDTRMFASVRACHKSISRTHTTSHSHNHLFIDTKRVKIWENVRATQ